MSIVDTSSSNEQEQCAKKKCRCKSSIDIKYKLNDISLISNNNIKRNNSYPFSVIANGNMMIKKFKIFIKEQWVLLNAVGNKKYKTVMRLFNKNKKHIPNINWKYKNDNTVLHYAIFINDYQMMNILLELGASIEMKNNKGETPLYYATINQRIHMIDSILSKGANINCLDNENNTPLMKATSIGNKILVKLYLTLNADINIRNIYGESCFDLIPNFTIYTIYKNHFPIEEIKKHRNSYSRMIFEKNNYIKLNGRRDMLRQLIYKENKLTDLIRNSGEFFDIYINETKRDKSFIGLPNKMKLSDLEIIDLIGKGAFGEVYLVKLKNSDNMYALKTLEKKRIIKPVSKRHIQVEKSVYTKFHNPFIIKFYRSFQSSLYLYQLIEYAPNGSLKQFIEKYKTLTEKDAKLISAQIIIAFEHMHKQGIIYRDLKPDNILFDKDGYVKLTDFGLCKEGIYDNRRARSFCGSMDYVPPEVLNKVGHGRAADWYLLGTVIYEMLEGNPPYYTPLGNEELIKNIKSAKLTFPIPISTNAENLIRNLLSRNVSKRLGASKNDSDDVKNHPFYKGINFEKIYNKEFFPGEMYTHAIQEENRKLDKPKMEWFCFKDMRYEEGTLVINENDTNNNEQIKALPYLENWDFEGFK